MTCAECRKVSAKVKMICKRRVPLIKYECVLKVCFSMRKTFKILSKTKRGLYNMGFFDSLKSSVKSEVNRNVNNAMNSAVNNAVNNIGKGKSSSEKFTFAALPTSVAELQALPEASMDSPYKTAALALAALCNFEKDQEATFAMLDFLKGPEPLNPTEKQFLKDRLRGKEYKSFSFFEGATVANGYVPTAPYTITVSSNPYSFDEENWATMHVQSSGADSPRPIKLRKKPSTGQWFINDIQCLSDIRIPAAQDPWA